MCVDGVDECCDGGIFHLLSSLSFETFLSWCVRVHHMIYIYIYIMNDFAIVYDAIVDYYY